MYNRYTPQPDGTYKRKSIPIPEHKKTFIPAEDPEQKYPDVQLTPPNIDNPKPRTTQKPRPTHHRTEVSAGTFLKDLLPKNLDTGDLLIIILLLLMASDANDDHGNALFTLALYLFM